MQGWIVPNGDAQPNKCILKKGLEGAMRALFLSARHWVSLGEHVFGVKIPIKQVKLPWSYSTLVPKFHWYSSEVGESSGNTHLDQECPPWSDGMQFSGVSSSRPSFSLVQRVHPW